MTGKNGKPRKRVRLPIPVSTPRRELDNAKKTLRVRLEEASSKSKKQAGKLTGKLKSGAAPNPMGRPPGTPNRTTAFLRQTIFLAGELEGADGKGKDGLLGYVRSLARYEKKTYVMLLAKCMPQKIQADLDPNGLAIRMLQTAAAQKSLLNGNSTSPIDITPRLAPPRPNGTNGGGQNGSGANGNQ